MTSFIDDVIKTGKASAGSSKETDDFMAPFLEAMRQEGSAVMKQPCN